MTIVQANKLTKNRAVIGYGGDGVPKMGKQGDQYQVRDKGQQEWVQSRGSQGGHEAQLRETMRLRCYLRRRLPTGAGLPMAHHPLPPPQSGHWPRPSPLEIRSVFVSSCPYLYFSKLTNDVMLKQLSLHKLTWYRNQRAQNLILINELILLFIFIFSPLTNDIVLK